MHVQRVQTVQRLRHIKQIFSKCALFQTYTFSITGYFFTKPLSHIQITQIVELLQVHVDTMEKSVGRGPFNGYCLRCELTKTEKSGGGISLCSFCCQCPARGCDFVFVRVFGRNGPVRSLCEVELMDPKI